MSDYFKKMSEKLKKVKASGGGNYIKEGVHRLRVKSARFTEDRNDQAMFVAEFEVLETNSPDENHGVGRQVDYVIKSTNEAYFPNVKSLILALYNSTDAEFDATSDDDQAEMLEMCFGEQQAAVGREVIADAIMATAKKIKQGQTAPTEYTRIRWSAVPEAAPSDEEQTQASAEA